jgi:hypothetical protein
MQYEYYYNRFGKEKWRNNLIYTSLMSTDQKTFVKWYKNDTDYHQGKNEVVDPAKMDEKWDRELHYLSNMAYHNPDMVPEILEVNVPERKIYLKVDGPDFWQNRIDNSCDFDKILPDWQEQMLAIIQAHRDRGWHKYSMHPSSYFIVDGKLKSINYFFTYHKDEPNICLNDVHSHISGSRKESLFRQVLEHGIALHTPSPWESFDKLLWETFKSEYPLDFIEKARCIK